jgi:hypothetical protein
MRKPLAQAAGLDAIASIIAAVWRSETLGEDASFLVDPTWSFFVMR